MFGISEDIWNAYTKKEKMYVFCEKMHILKAAQFVNRKVLGNEPAAMLHEAQDTDNKQLNEFYKEYEYLFHEIEAYAQVESKNNILISGYLSTFRKGGNHFFKEVQKHLPDSRIIAFSHSGRNLTYREHKQIQYEFLAFPDVPFTGGYKKNLDVPLTQEMRKTISEKQFLKDAIYNIKEYHDDIGDGYAEAMVYYLYITTQKIVKDFNLKLLIVHNVLYPMNDVMVQTCKEMGVPTLFFEFGALPGTFVIESQGQMGASIVSTQYEQFMNQSINESELENANNVINYLQTSGLNRNVQPANNGIERLKQSLDLKKPIILYAGQNDYDSGICPYNEHSKKYHSPIFSNSDEAAIYLSELARKNEWNLIYKPHPLCVKHGKCLPDGLPENIIWVSDIDINEIIDMADVVITILSQVGEIALIRDRATVMLGYTQIRGKGCCYEAYKKEDIELVIQSAIKNGYTLEQKNNYKEYVARMLKYYLFDDCSERDIRFGQSIDAAANYIKQALKENQDEVEEESTQENSVPKYIFAETDMFAKRIMSNELDFLDVLGNTVGKENVIVKLYDRSSQIRFEMRGYKTIFMSNEEWYRLINSPNMIGYYIISAYPLYEYEQVSMLKAIWFEKMLVVKENSMPKYRKGLGNNYSPANMNSFIKLLD